MNEIRGLTPILNPVQSQESTEREYIDLNLVDKEENLAYRIDISEEARKKQTQTKPTLTTTYNADEQKEITQLKQRDQAVRAHERAHVLAGGNLITKGASYGYQTGPDGHRYAVSGEVSIDTSPVRDDPQATLEKAIRVQQAALAPIDPSQQDYAVASRATQMASEARVEIARLRYREQEPKSTSGTFLPGTID